MKNKTDAQLDAWLIQTKAQDLHSYDVSCELWRKEVESESVGGLDKSVNRAIDVQVRS